MDEHQLHVVFGAGQVGSAMAAHLAGKGIAVRSASRRRPATLPGVDWRGVDAADAEAAVGAANGAAVIYQCLNAPYHQWPERFPPLQRGVLAAAERTGALLVSLENVYGYGPIAGRPMTEDLPLAATGAKGRARAATTAELLAAADAARVRIAIGRASDFGPGVTGGSTLGERVFGNALACACGADFIGDPGLPHTYSYIPDIAALGHPRHRPPRRGRGSAPARPGDGQHPGAAGRGGLRGRAPGRRPVRAEARPARPWPRQPDAAGAGRDPLPVRRALRPGRRRGTGPRSGRPGMSLDDAVAATLAWYRTLRPAPLGDGSSAWWFSRLLRCLERKLRTVRSTWYIVAVFAVSMIGLAVVALSPRGLRAVACRRPCVLRPERHDCFIGLCSVSC